MHVKLMKSSIGPADICQEQGQFALNRLIQSLTIPIVRRWVKMSLSVLSNLLKSHILPIQPTLTCWHTAPISNLIINIVALDMMTLVYHMSLAGKTRLSQTPIADPAIGTMANTA
jgi:hypothetical protein